MTTSPVMYPDTYERIDSPLVVRLLGGLRYLGGSIQLAMSCRQVFALLASRTGQRVTVEDISTELWHDSYPRSFAATVQTYILHLRKAIGRDIIETTNGGYLLAVRNRLDVDAHRFDYLVTQAKRDMDSGAHRSAKDFLLASFSLWSVPLADVRTGVLLGSFEAGLRDRHATALGLHYDIELRSGRHRDVVDELAALTRSDPSREDWAERLMLALYRSRRAAEALQAYTRLRVALSEEHGMDPCPALRTLHAQILAGDAALELDGEKR